jgi:arylsulfatase
MYRTATHKLVLWHGRPATDRLPEGELYDLTADPDEIVNQWWNPAYQGVKAELLVELMDSYVAREDRSPVRAAPW